MSTAALFGALTLILMVAPGVVIDWGILGDEKLSVYELLNYGDTLRVGLLIALIFAILFVVFAVVLLLLNLLNKKFKAEGLVALCACVLEVVAAIMFFLAKPLAGLDGLDNASLGVGAVLAGIFAIIGACALGVCVIKKLVK